MPTRSTVVFDLQAVQSEAHASRGIGRYTADLAFTLVSERPGAVSTFAWNDRLARPALLDELSAAIAASAAPETRIEAFRALRGRHVDVLHVNSVFEPLPLGDMAVPVHAARTVVTCYDLIPYRFPDVYLTDPAAALRYRTRLGMLTAADMVVTDSHAAAHDVIELLGVSRRRVTTIGGGVGHQFRPPGEPVTEVRRALTEALPGLGDRFVFVPSGADWRKNNERAIEAFGLLPAEVRNSRVFVLGGSFVGGYRDWLAHLAAEAGVTLLMPGHVDDATLVRLYQTAELVVVPSLYEGFGLPALEARRCGAPVIAGQTSSLFEIIPDERALFDPWDAASIAALTARALLDPETRQIVAAVPLADLDWSSTAARVAQVYAHLAESTRSTPATVTERRRRRLAVVTLLPPTPSGIADHSWRLLQAIASECPDVDVTAFVERTATAREWPFAVADAATLVARSQAGEFDQVLYCMGNHRFHRGFLPLMRLVPGAALVHDVRQRWSFDPAAFDAANQEFYDGTATDDDLFTRPLADAATAMLVQSGHAADLLRADAGESRNESIRAPVIDVGPHPCPPIAPDAITVGAAARAADRAAGELPWVASLGIFHESKQSDLFVAAARHLRGHARIALVGLGGGRFTTPADRADMTVTEHVDDDEFVRWLCASSVLVQLRATSNGESSGVLARAFAAGTPVIATDLGATAGYPDDLVVKVPVDIGAAELATVVDDVLADPDRLAALAAAGRTWAATHTYAHQARQVVAALFTSS